MSEAETGICDLCGQEMVLTADDCWHPYYVDKGCPPEALIDGVLRSEWGRPGRPGREHFVSPVPTEEQQ